MFRQGIHNDIKGQDASVTGCSKKKFFPGEIL